MARTTPARYELGEPLNSELEDLCEGYKGAPATRLVREAVEAYISKCLDEEPKVKERYLEARKRRLEGGDRKLAVMKPKDS